MKPSQFLTNRHELYHMARRILGPSCIFSGTLSCDIPYSTYILVHASTYIVAPPGNSPYPSLRLRISSYGLLRPFAVHHQRVPSTVYPVNTSAKEPPPTIYGNFDRHLSTHRSHHEAWFVSLLTQLSTIHIDFVIPYGPGLVYLYLSDSGISALTAFANVF